MILLEHIANPGRIMCKGNRSGFRRDQSGNHGKERRFAAAARTDDCKKFPFRNRKRDITQGLGFSVKGMIGKVYMLKT